MATAIAPPAANSQGVLLAQGWIVCNTLVSIERPDDPPNLRSGLA
jgi:hypothetical protein